jgi:GAF domain-containing protein
MPDNASVGTASAAAELQELLLSTTDIEAFLQNLAGLAARSMGADLSCGLTLRRDGRPITVANSDDRAARVDELQYDQDDGPCLRSMRTAQTILIEDLAADDRWGDYRMHALAHGVRSSLSIPLHVDGQPLGALNLYATKPDAFEASARAQAERFAAEASRALALAVRLAHHTEMTAHLQSALSSRAVIDQAIGVIMGQNRCDADQAFALLRSASQHRNVKLRIIAAEIVAAVSGKQPPR